LGGAVVVSIVVHTVAIAVAVLGFGRQVPAAEDPAAITVFVPSTPPAAAAVEEKPVEPPKPEPPPPPAPDYTLPPPEEALAVPDFKAPPPPPPKPSPPRPVPPKPQITAAPRPAPAAPSARQQPVAPVDSAALPAAPSIVPGWNVQLASWFAAHKRYPSAARSRGEEGEVLVHFTVESDGHVIDVAVEHSSGHADLDAAVLAMLQGATVPPPGAVATRTVRIHFRLDD
jgi:periplasmic protein TonB